MSSRAAADRVQIDDRTTKARIRDAAIDCFTEHGMAGTSARKVATAAGVSPGSVIHHFGSMDGLRSACDEHVAAYAGPAHEILSEGIFTEPLATHLQRATAGIAGGEQHTAPTPPHETKAPAVTTGKGTS